MSNTRDDVLDFGWKPPTLKDKIFSQDTILTAISIVSLFAAWALLVHFPNGCDGRLRPVRLRELVHVPSQWSGSVK